MPEASLQGQRDQPSCSVSLGSSEHCTGCLYAAHGLDWTDGALQEGRGEYYEVGTLGRPITPKGARLGMLPGL